MADKKVQNSQDRRVLRTKKILREKLFELLEEKSLENISVKELAQAADINRSTFYFYYNDINDMLLQIQDEIYAVFVEEVLSPDANFVTLDDFVAYCTRFLVFCKKNEAICKFAGFQKVSRKIPLAFLRLPSIYLTMIHSVLRHR